MLKTDRSRPRQAPFKFREMFVFPTSLLMLSVTHSLSDTAPGI